MILVIVESPYAGDVDLNMRYLRACLRDCILRGESPYASHGLLTQPGVLDDLDPEQRALGIAAGFAWREAAAVTVFYTNLGWSNGMRAALRDCIDRGLPHELRGLQSMEWAKGLRS